MTTYKDLLKRAKNIQEAAKRRNETTKYNIFSAIFEEAHSIDRDELQNIAQEMAAVLSYAVDREIKPEELEKEFIYNMKEYHGE